MNYHKALKPVSVMVLLCASTVAGAQTNQPDKSALPVSSPSVLPVPTLGASRSPKAAPSPSASPSQNPAPSPSASPAQATGPSRAGSPLEWPCYQHWRKKGPDHCPA